MPFSENYDCSFGISVILVYSFQTCQFHASHIVAGVSFFQVRIGVVVLVVNGLWGSDRADWIWWSSSAKAVLWICALGMGNGSK